MSPTYIIYSSRAQGWVNRSGAYGTLIDEAKTFAYAEAMEYCKRLNNTETFPVLIPVRFDDAVAAGFAK